MWQRTVRETLERAARLVEGGWTRHYNAIDENGRSVGARSEDAVAFCATGAIIRACHEMMEKDRDDPAWRTWPDPDTAIIARFGRWLGWNVVVWNDMPWRTRRDVVGRMREFAAEHSG